jgi:hypothetical protein
MIASSESPHGALKRMLANGPLTAVPKRPADQALVAMLAAARLEADRDFSEAEVNERLEAWLDAISEPYGIDHVTLRRMLVDLRLLVRTKSGSAYRVNPGKAAALDALRTLEPAAVLADVRAERDARKQRHTP